MIDYYSNPNLYFVREKDGEKVVLRKEGKYWFGPFPISRFYDIEKSEDVVRNKKTKEKMESVEFVYASKMKFGVDKIDSLAFVEVKSSLPKLTQKKNFSHMSGQMVKIKKTPKVVTEQLATFWDSLSNLHQKFVQSADTEIPEDVIEKLAAFSDSLSDEFIEVIGALWIIPRTIHEICDKFINSWRLLLSVAYDREKSKDIPFEILNSVQNPQTPLVFVLIVDIEGRILEAVKNNTPANKNDAPLSMEQQQLLEDMTHTFLEIANLSLTEHLKERLHIEQKVCQTRINVMTISQARKKGLIASNPI